MSDNGPVIVVGYDGSPSARAAVEFAARRAGAGGKLYIVHSYAPPSDWLGFPYYNKVLNDHKEHGQAVIDDLLEHERDTLEGTDYVTELLGEPPAEAIANVAEARHADEIVVGTHGHRGLRAALGGVSHDLLHNAKLPTVLVPRPE